MMYGYGPPMMYGPPMHYGQRPPFQGMRPMYPPPGPGAPVNGYNPVGGGAPYMHARPMPYMEYADAGAKQPVRQRDAQGGQDSSADPLHLELAEQPAWACEVVDKQRTCTVCGKQFNVNDVASFNRHLCQPPPGRSAQRAGNGLPGTGPDPQHPTQEWATPVGADDSEAHPAGETSGNGPSSLAADGHVAAAMPPAHAQRVAAVGPEGAAAAAVAAAAAARPVLSRYARLLCSHEPAPGEVVLLTLRKGGGPEQRWGVRLAGDERPRVKAIDHTALAWQQGLRAGDVLLTVNGARCGGHADTTDVLRKAVGTLKLEVSRRQYRVAAETLQRYERGGAARRALAGQLGAKRAMQWARGGGGGAPAVRRSASTEEREMDREMEECARVLAAHEVAWKRAVEETKEAEAKVAEARAVASAASKLRAAAEAGAFEAEKVAVADQAMSHGHDGKGGRGGGGRGRGGSRGRGRGAAREGGGAKGGEEAAGGPVRAQPAWATLLSES